MQDVEFGQQASLEMAVELEGVGGEVSVWRPVFPRSERDMLFKGRKTLCEPGSGVLAPAGG